MASYWRGAVKSEPRFENLLKVLRREAPDRPTLFEFFLNQSIGDIVIGPARNKELISINWLMPQVATMMALGYDYATSHNCDAGFPTAARDQAASISMSGNGLISDRATFERYSWPDFRAAGTPLLDRGATLLRKGAKLIAFGPGGVLENVTAIVGYETLCMMMVDDEQLVFDLFEAVGSRLVEYYQQSVRHPAVGAVISNDDWGFKTQPMLSPADMRRFVFPWHKRIVETIHAAGLPAILHSCGNLASLMDGIIDDLGYDAKHSYEDNILPVEQAYDKWGGRIAILGGMDLDFVCRSTPEQVYQRSKAMLAKTGGRGYALGTGNSVPAYVPPENYFAMVAAATDAR